MLCFSLESLDSTCGIYGSSLRGLTHSLWLSPGMRERFEPMPLVISQISPSSFPRQNFPSKGNTGGASSLPFIEQTYWILAPHGLELTLAIIRKSERMFLPQSTGQ